MGGRSSGGGEIRNGAMIFTGSTNTNGGGFSSVRASDVQASDVQWDLTGFDGLAARVRADGRRYVFHIFTGLNYNNGNVFNRRMFESDPLVNAESGSVPEKGGWQNVFVAFRDFVPMVRGRAITGRAELLDPSKIRGIAAILRYPYRPYMQAGSMSRWVSGSSSSRTMGKYRCEARGCFITRHARRSETSKRSLIAKTASRFRCGLRSFPTRPPATSPCPATGPPPAISAGRSPSSGP